MLRKEATIRSAWVTHMTKMMKMGLFTIDTCRTTPAVVLHLCLERLRNESDIFLIPILNSICMCNPDYIRTIMGYNNCVINNLKKNQT